MSGEKKDPMVEMIDIIRDGLPPAAIFEQLAEECVELAQCALKQARIIRGENPTPAELVDVVKDTEEEVADVLNCFNVLGLHASEQLMGAKLSRWVGRIQQYESMNSQRPKPIGPEDDVEVTPAEVIE